MAKKIFPKRKRRTFSNAEKRMYYTNWLKGYNDNSPRANLAAAKEDLASQNNSGIHSPYLISILKARIAGMKAQLADRKKGKYDE